MVQNSLSKLETIQALNLSFLTKHKGANNSQKYVLQPLLSVIQLSLLGKASKKIVNDKNNDENIQFFESMADVLEFYLDFLNDPINYCNKNNCKIYSEKNADEIESTGFLKFFHKFNEQYFVEIGFNVSEMFTFYFSCDIDEINDSINNFRVVKLDEIKDFLLKNELFFKEQLTYVNGLMNEYNQGG